jgi:murein DD-endopeptidase MepM/ murein hydrolase activator NlpD
LGICGTFGCGLFSVEQLKLFSNFLALLASALLLAACSSNALRWTPDYHTVRSGETLYSIAHSYNLDHRQLALWNHLGDGSVIRDGQRLRLKPATGSVSGSSSQNTSVKPPSQPTVPAPAWRWPTAGSVYLHYGAAQKTESGIRITGKNGQVITAAAAGEVVYAGSGLASYGNLLIIKHNEGWLSAYGFNSVLLVQEGQKVGSGQSIARMGQDTTGRAVLHFEIRQNGQPVDPVRYLPPR